jgi:hypothetical protein
MKRIFTVTYYRRPGFGLFFPLPYPPPSPTSCVSPVELTNGGGVVRGEGRSQIIGLLYGFLQAFFISKETPTAEWRKVKETLK